MQTIVIRICAPQTTTRIRRGDFGMKRRVIRTVQVGVPVLLLGGLQLPLLGLQRPVSPQQLRGGALPPQKYQLRLQP